MQRVQRALRGGWYAGVLILEDVPPPFDYRGEGGNGTFEERVEVCRQWYRARSRAARRVCLVRANGEDIAGHRVTEADRIDGPACPREPTDAPILVWTERRGQVWELRLLEGGAVRTVLRQCGILRFPAVAIAANGPVLAYECDADIAKTEVVLVDRAGVELFRMAGRAPHLIAVGSDLLLMTEQATRNTIALRLSRIRDGAVVSEVDVRHDDYTFNADVVSAGTGHEAFVAAETSPAHGHGSQIGLHREIRVWRYTDDGIEPVGADTGLVPVERRTFMSLGPENMPPIQPRIIAQDGRPTVVFKQFRYYEFKTFGWDIFRSELTDDGWSEPVRVSPSLSVPDSNYCVLPWEDGTLCVTTGLENDGHSAPSYDHRVEIFRFDPEHRLDRFGIPADKQAPYVMPTGYRDVAVEPPPLASTPAYADRTLIWGDLHWHTTYSKCVACADGSPDETVRYLRHVLGCRVLGFCEHTPRQSYPEYTWDWDRLELLAGDDAVVIYGTEPAMRPGRHTNCYAKDREMFDRLCCAVASHGMQREPNLRHLRTEFPLGSVLVLRHFHGNMADDAYLMQSFEPRIEVAMEAMQGRNNAMIAPEGKAPFFPNQFLDQGRKIGLVGGTDHYRKGPNHFCLTGFWVKEISADGVWEALQNRFAFGMSDAKIALAATLDGQPMGSMVSLNDGAELRVRLDVSCGRSVQRATLIKDGQLLPWADVGAGKATLELVDSKPGTGYHWYVPTVQADTAYGSKDSGFAHASPFFVNVSSD